MHNADMVFLDRLEQGGYTSSWRTIRLCAALEKVFGEVYVSTFSGAHQAYAEEVVDRLGLGFRILDDGDCVVVLFVFDRFEEALAHAGQAGPRGAIKIVFDVGGKKTATRREA